MKLVRIGNTTCDNKDKTQKQFKKVKQTDSSTWLRCPSKLNNPVTVTQANFQSKGKALYHMCARAHTYTLRIQYKWIYQQEGGSCEVCHTGDPNFEIFVLVIGTEMTANYVC